MWFLLIVGFLVILAGCDRGIRFPGMVSWFDLLPLIRPSKKQSGRVQQKRRR